MVLNDPMDAMTEALLVFAARRDHVQNVIVPSLLAGQVVLCDRFTDATFAYQGQGRSFDLAILNTLEQWVQGTGLDAALPQGLLQPALTVWFDLPAQVAAQRLATARVPDKFEAQPRAFFEQVSQGYAMRCAAAPQRFERINANQPLESVWTDVEAALRGRGLLR